MKAAVLFENVIVRWRTLAPREQRMIAWGAGVLLLALIWFALFQPAWLGRQKLSDELPELRAQVAKMDSLATEAGSLSGSKTSAKSLAVVRADLQKALAAAGLANRASIDAGADVIRVKFDRVTFDAVLAWLYQVVRDSRLRVADVSVIREPDAGRVTATFALERPLARGQQ